MAKWKRVVTLVKATGDITYQELTDAGWFDLNNLPYNVLGEQLVNTDICIPVNTVFIPGKAGDSPQASMEVDECGGRLGSNFNWTDGLLGNHTKWQVSGTWDDFVDSEDHGPDGAFYGLGMEWQYSLFSGSGEGAYATDKRLNNIISVPIRTHTGISWDTRELAYIGGYGIDPQGNAGQGNNHIDWDNLYIGHYNFGTTNSVPGGTHVIKDGVWDNVTNPEMEANTTKPWLVVTARGHDNPDMHDYLTAQMNQSVGYPGSNTPYITTLMFNDPTNQFDTNAKEGTAIFMGDHNHGDFLLNYGASGSQTLVDCESENHAGSLVGPDDIVIETGNTVIYKLKTGDISGIYHDLGLRLLSWKVGITDCTTQCHLEETASGNLNKIWHWYGSNDDLGTALPAGYKGWKVIGGRYLVVYDHTEIEDAGGQTGSFDPSSGEWILKLLDNMDGVAFPQGHNPAIEDDVLYTNQMLELNWSVTTIEAANINIPNDLTLPTTLLILDEDGEEILNLEEFSTSADSAFLLTAPDSGIAQLALSDTPLSVNWADIVLNDTSNFKNLSRIRLKYINGGNETSDVSLELSVRDSTSSENYIVGDSDSNILYKGTVPIYYECNVIADFSDLMTSMNVSEFQTYYLENLSNYVDENGVTQFHDYAQDVFDTLVDNVAVGSMVSLSPSLGQITFPDQYMTDGSDIAYSNAIWILTDGADEAV
tara:strand:- start:2693 stop:4810 length:2118 start_codon:yes stop_codon:yes gene_type:complete